MLFLTLNTHSWLEEDQVDKISRLAAFIAEHEVDTIALQEVNQHFHRPVVPHPDGYLGGGSMPVREDNYALLLVRALARAGLTYRWAAAETHIGWGRYDEAIAVLTRLPVTAHEALELSPGYGYKDVRRRRALAVRVQASGYPLWCISTHFSWWERQGEHLFAAEFELFDAAVARLGLSAPVIIGGDFNTDATGEGYELVSAAGLVDTRTLAGSISGEHTVHRRISGWESLTETKRLDYVFTDRAAVVHSHAVVLADNTELAISDHSAVLVQIDPAGFGPPPHGEAPYPASAQHPAPSQRTAPA